MEKPHGRDRRPAVPFPLQSSGAGTPKRGLNGDAPEGDDRPPPVAWRGPDCDDISLFVISLAKTLHFSHKVLL